MQTQSFEKLLEGLNTHAALNNSFYTRWTRSELPIEKIAVFARNYLEFSVSFPETLAGLIINVKDVAARVEFSKILYSELGYGKVEKSHGVLFEKFCDDLSVYMGKPNFLSKKNLETNFPLLNATTHLINEQRKLYSEDPAIGVGAQLALESQAYPMLSFLYEGARKYAYLWPTLSHFHESCEFFYIHIGSVEKDHKEEALQAIKRIVGNDLLLLQKAEHGFEQNLSLFAKFWDSIGKEL